MVSVVLEQTVFAKKYLTFWIDQKNNFVDLSK